jgi:serine O-acetyltransferase
MSLARAFDEFRTTVRADHEAMRSTRERYPTEGTSMQSHGVLGDVVHNIGFQMLVAIRIMRLVRDAGIPFGAQLVSRLIRHVYGAEIHWNATLAPGVTIVHGNGLVVSHGSVVGPGCILFQHVTLGESIDPLSRRVGAPTLDDNVHVGPGAVLLGPIHVGGRTKIMANSVVDRSVPAGSVVRVAAPEVAPRGAVGDGQ